MSHKAFTIRFQKRYAEALPMSCGEQARANNQRAIVLRPWRSCNNSSSTDIRRSSHASICNLPNFFDFYAHLCGWTGELLLSINKRQNCTCCPHYSSGSAFFNQWTKVLLHAWCSCGLKAGLEPRPTLCRTCSGHHGNISRLLSSSLKGPTYKPKASSEARGEKIALRVVIIDMGAAGVRPILACQTAENSKHRFDHCHLLNQAALYSRSRSYPAARTDGFGLSKWLLTQLQRNIWVNSHSGFLPKGKQVQLPSTRRKWDPFTRVQRSTNQSCSLAGKALGHKI